MRYECPVCGAIFGSMIELSKHLEQHQKKIYKCPSCGKTYDSLEEMNRCLKRHIEEENIKIKEKEKERKAIVADYKEVCNKIDALIGAFNKAHGDSCTLKPADIEVTTLDMALGQEIININSNQTKVENKKVMSNSNSNKNDITSFENLLKTILNEAYGFED